MQAILGIIFHSLGGASSGSWYMPYNLVKQWRWEIYWIVGGLFSWAIMPYIATVLTSPGWQDILSATDSSTIRLTYILGVLWGIGGLTYGLGIRYLGMSLGNSVLLGITSLVGSLGLPILRDVGSLGEILPAGDSFTYMLATTSGRMSKSESHYIFAGQQSNDFPFIADRRHVGRLSAAFHPSRSTSSYS